MTGWRRFILAGAAGLITATQAPAAAVQLAEYAFNLDGHVSDMAVPAGVGGSFDYTTGLGTLTISLSGAGHHHVSLFLDHEIDEATNTFFNELGSATGAPAPGQSWEIDEPGFRQPNPGTIFQHFSDGALANANASTTADDVSMALAWDFNLDAGDTAVISFLVSETAPGSGFYLTQTDPDSQAGLHFSSGLRIGDGGTVPEPASLALVGLALAAAWQARRRMARA